MLYCFAKSTSNVAADTKPTDRATADKFKRQTMNRAILSVVIMIVTATTLKAQSTGELVRIFESSSAMSTSRNAAMGGAFTSLGADPSSMDVNPAGLGMYRSSEFSFTGYMLSRRSTSVSERMTGNLQGLPATDKGTANKLNANISNAAFVYSLTRQNGKAVRALNFGFSVSQQTNFRSSTYAPSPYTRSSIADMFGAQLFGISPDALKDDNAYRGMPASAWGAVGAVQSGLIFDNDIVNVGGKDYFRYGPFYYDDGVQVGSLVDGDIVKPSLNRITSGSTINYNLSFATNISDRLYLGLTVNIVDLDYSQRDLYREDTPQENHGDMFYLKYNQYLNMKGTTAGVKIGATVRPFGGLRIGAAVHSPVLMSVTEFFSTDNDNLFAGNNNFYAESPIMSNTYKVRSAPKLTTGVSYTFGKWAILSVDYEHVWYNSMDVKGINYAPGETTFRSEFRNNYRAAGTIRAGAELNIGNGMMLRGGYNRKANNNKLTDNKYGTVERFSAGFGYRGRVMFLDLAYVNTKYRTAPSVYYGYTLSIPNGNTPITESYISDSRFSSSINENNFLMTFGIKF